MDCEKLALAVRNASDGFDFDKLKDVFPPNILEAYAKHSHCVLTKLHEIITASIPKQKKIERLIEILDTHERGFMLSSIDPTFFTYFPVTKALMAVALFLAEETTLPMPLLRFLTPSIERILGLDQISELTKYVSNQDFDLTGFISGSDGEMLSVQGLLDSAAEDTALVFPDWFDKKSCVCFTEEDRVRLRDSVGEASRNYYDAVERKHKITQGYKPVIGWEIKILARALISGSYESGVYSDTQASEAETKTPIRRFYNYWMALDESIRKKIGDYKSYNKETLAGCLARVFIADVNSDEQHFSENFSRVKSDAEHIAFTCVDQIGRDLELILTVHEAELMGIPLAHLTAEERDALNGQEAPPTKEELEALSKALEEAIEQKKPRRIPGDDKNSMLRTSVFHAIANVFFTCSDEIRLEKLRDEFQAYFDALDTMTTVFVLTPKKYWALLTKTFANEILAVFKKTEKARTDRLRQETVAQGQEADAQDRLAFHTGWHDGHPLCYMLCALPTNHWKEFVTCLRDNAFRVISDFDTMNYTVLRALREIPEARWPDYREALKRECSSIWVSSRNIFEFIENSSDLQSKVVSFFHREITGALKHPSIIKGLFYLSKKAWRATIQLFSKLLPAINQDNTDWLVRVVQLLDEKHRKEFLLPLLSCFTWSAKASIKQFSELLLPIPTNDFQKVFSVVDAGFCAKHITSVKVLRDFLKQFIDHRERLRLIGETLKGCVVITESFTLAQLNEVLLLFPDLKDEILHITRFYLPYTFTDHFSIFRVFSEAQLPIPAEIKNVFYPNLFRALPILLDISVLFPNGPARQPAALVDLACKFAKIEGCTEEMKVLEKLRLLKMTFSTLKKAGSEEVKILEERIKEEFVVSSLLVLEAYYAELLKKDQCSVAVETAPIVRLSSSRVTTFSGRNGEHIAFLGRRDAIVHTIGSDSENDPPLVHPVNDDDYSSNDERDTQRTTTPVNVNR